MLKAESTVSYDSFQGETIPPSLPSVLIIMKGKKTPETPITLGQSALVEQSTVLGHSRVSPLPHLTQLFGYNDARVSLSEVVHQNSLSGWAWVCMGVHGCPVLLRSERAAVKSGTRAACEQAGTLQLCSFHRLT